jgi:hypothetical protein
MNTWVPSAFLYALYGITGGALLGLLGLKLTAGSRPPARCITRQTARSSS